MSTGQRPAGSSRNHRPSLRRLLILTATIAVLAVLAPTASASSKADRAFHLEKVCTPAGDSCTVTVSTSGAIPVGTTITYLGDSFDALRATIHVDHGTATGDCDIEPVIDGTGPGQCAFAGGTGSLRHLKLTVDVTTVDFETWFWDGTVKSAPPGHGTCRQRFGQD